MRRQERAAPSILDLMLAASLPHSSLRSPVTLFPSFIASQSPTFLWLILSALHSPSPRLTPRLAHSVGQEERSGT